MAPEPSCLRLRLLYLPVFSNFTKPAPRLRPSGKNSSRLTCTWSLPAALQTAPSHADTAFAELNSLHAVVRANASPKLVLTATSKLLVYLTTNSSSH